MDSFSIISTAAGVSKLSRSVSTTLKDLISAAKHVDEKIEYLYVDVKGLSAAIAAVESQVKDSDVPKPSSIPIWRDTDAILDACWITLQRLKNQLDQIPPPPKSRRQSFFRYGFRHYRLRLPTEDVDRLRVKFQTHTETLNLLRSTLKVHILVTRRDSASSPDEINSKLAALEQNIQDFHVSSRLLKDANNSYIAQTTESLRNTAKIVASNASDIAVSHTEVREGITFDTRSGNPLDGEKSHDETERKKENAAAVIEEEVVSDNHLRSDNAPALSAQQVSSNGNLQSDNAPALAAKEVRFDENLESEITGNFISPGKEKLQTQEYSEAERLFRGASDSVEPENSTGIRNNPADKHAIGMLISEAPEPSNVEQENTVPRSIRDQTPDLDQTAISPEPPNDEQKNTVPRSTHDQTLDLDQTAISPEPSNVEQDKTATTPEPSNFEQENTVPRSTHDQTPGLDQRAASPSNMESANPKVEQTSNNMQSLDVPDVRSKDDEVGNTEKFHDSEDVLESEAKNARSLDVLNISSSKEEVQTPLLPSNSTDVTEADDARNSNVFNISSSKEEVQTPLPPSNSKDIMDSEVDYVREPTVPNVSPSNEAVQTRQISNDSKDVMDSGVDNVREHGVCYVSQKNEEARISNDFKDLADLGSKNARSLDMSDAGSNGEEVPVLEIPDDFKDAADSEADNVRSPNVPNGSSSTEGVAITEISTDFKDLLESEGPQTALFSAARRGTSSEVAYALFHGANAEQLDDKGRGALHLACAAKNHETVRRLLQAGVNVDTHDIEGQTPLELALFLENKRLISLLLKYNANVERCGNGALSPLVLSVLDGNVDIAALLLDKGANMKADSKYGMAVHYAACLENARMLKFLILRGADINQESAMATYAPTPILQAAFSKKYYMIHEALKLGADPNTTDGNGGGIFHALASHDDADWNEFEQIVCMLKAHGEDLNSRNDQGRTPLDTALSLGKSTPARILRKHGAETHILMK